MPSGPPRAGLRLTSVISLAAHFFFLVLVLTAGAFHLFLHLFQLIQVNPSNQLKITAHLKKVQMNNRIMSHRPNRALPGGEIFPPPLSLDRVFGTRTKQHQCPRGSFLLLGCSRGGSVLYPLVPTFLKEHWTFLTICSKKHELQLAGNQSMTKPGVQSRCPIMLFELNSKV